MGEVLRNRIFSKLRMYVKINIFKQAVLRKEDVVMERRREKSRVGAVVAGFFIGVLFTVLVMFLFIRYALAHPKTIMVHAGRIGVQQMAARTVESMPKDYLGKKQKEIAASVQNFADALSKNKISETDMRRLAGKMFAIVADQNITDAEMDDMIRSLNALSGKR